MSSILHRPGRTPGHPSLPPYDFRRALPWTAFVAMLFWLNYSGRATLSPLLVSVERDLEIGHAAATSLPVSYTHLDVYKRQLSRPCRAGSSAVSG